MNSDSPTEPCPIAMPRPTLVQRKLSIEERAMIENRPIWYYHVPRMPLSYKFPVYETIRSGGTRKLTIIKFIKGSVPVR